jgi:pimeloyl-ACP methyl ester carboxylesterase
VLAAPMRFAAVRRAPIAYGWLSKRGVPDEITASWARAARSSRSARRDLTKLLKAARPRLLKEAAQRFGEFDKPVLLAWGTEKDFFPIEDAERLAREFPQGRLERIEDSYTFVSEDQPERLAQLIAQHARTPVAASA